MPTSRQTDTGNEELIKAILNRLIPANDELPAAGDMGLSPEIISLAAKQGRFNKLFSRAVNRFKSHNTDFIDIDSNSQDQRIDEFEHKEPELFETLINISYIVYYKQSVVHKKIGWNGAPPQPDGNKMLPWNDSVLVNIRNRDPFWRKI